MLPPHHCPEESLFTGHSFLLHCQTLPHAKEDKPKYLSICPDLSNRRGMIPNVPFIRQRSVEMFVVLTSPVMFFISPLMIFISPLMFFISPYMSADISVHVFYISVDVENIPFLYSKQQFWYSKQQFLYSKQPELPGRSTDWCDFQNFLQCHRRNNRYKHCTVINGRSRFDKRLYDF